MGNRWWWPFGRRKTSVDDQYMAIATAERVIKETEKERDDYKRRLDDARQQAEERGRSLKLANKRAQNLQIRNHDLMQERESHMAEFDQRGTDLEKCKKERVEAEGLLKTCKKHRDDALKTVKDMKESLDTMSGRVDSQKKVIAEKDKEIEFVNGMLSEATAVLEGMKESDSHQSNMELEDEVDQRGTDLEKCEKERVEAESKIAKQKTAIASLSKELEDCKTINGNLNDQVFELETETREQSGTISHQSNMIASLTTEKNKLRAEKNKLAAKRRHYDSRPTLLAKIEASTAGRGRVPCFRFGIYGSENPEPDERPLCVSDYNGVPTRAEAELVLATISGGKIVVPNK